MVLVLHEAFGLTDSTLNTADEIAAVGYITVAPDMVSGRGPDGGGAGAFAATRQAGDAMTQIAEKNINAVPDD